MSLFSQSRKFVYFSTILMHVTSIGYLMASHETLSVQEVMNLFPRTVQEVKTLSSQAQELFIKKVNQLTELSKSEYCFNNVCMFFDRAEAAIFQALSIIYALKETSPDDEVRDAAHQEVIELEKCLLIYCGHNDKLYEVLKYYKDNVMAGEQLDDEQRLYIEKIVKDFRRRGLDLQAASREKIVGVNKEIVRLCQEFSHNISSDNRTISVPREALSGLPDEFINELVQTEDGNYILGVDYPTYSTVMDNCTHKNTRKALWQEFQNRATPSNTTVLEELMILRDEFAELLGYKDYAEFEIAEEMAESSENVRIFLDDLVAKSQAKARLEFEEMACELPESIELSPDGTLMPWDVRFLQESYKKKRYNIDALEIAKYFPLEHTIEQLLDIYSTFLGVMFEEVSVAADAFWHADVKLLKASRAGEVVGYILLDLFPRPNKYNHAAQVDIVQSLKNEDGSRNCAVAIVLANFPKPTKENPSLLKREDVITFFHEFGHAIHSLLGATRMAYFAGTRVKTDFVEMPSQMLEEWMWDPSMLKKVSKHYKTGEPLPDELIENILKIKNAESGFWVLRQCMLANLSLGIYKKGKKDIAALYQDIFGKHLHFIQFDPSDHIYFSFGHLTNYGARYYCYLWSKVFALDLFSHIKTYGILNPEIGERYVDEILAKGGSQDPNALLECFLGRKPNANAFFEDLGL